MGVPKMKKRLAAGLAVVAIGVGAAGAPAASAQQNVGQRGLVNLNVGDVTVLQNVGIGVAANVAAQVCGVQVNAAVLATQGVLNNGPGTVCEVATQTADVPITITNPASGPGGPGGPQNVGQNGLINVNVGDVTVLQDVAVGVAANVAANICGVQVNAAVLAQQLIANPGGVTECMAGPQGAQVPITITGTP
jgi:hypothetical protein